MPNKDTHLLAGAVVGLAVAAMKIPSLAPAHRGVELLFGALGGMVGAASPEALEPATSPNHRSVCHGGIAIAALVSASRAEVRANCLQQAIEGSGTGARLRRTEVARAPGILVASCRCFPDRLRRRLRIAPGSRCRN